MRTTLCVVLIVLLAGCGQDNPGPMSYSRDIAPIFLRRCVQCHNESESQANVQVQTYTHVMASHSRKSNLDVIRPGLPDSSQLFRVISSKEDKRRMPPPGAETKPLTEEQINRIRRWIAEGAKE